MKKQINTQLQDIADFFNLGEVAKVEKAAGNANDNSYITTQKGCFLVKIIQERESSEEVRTELDFVDRLQDAIKLVPYIRNKQGEALYVKDVIALVQPYIKNFKRGSDEGIPLELIAEQARMHLVDTSGLPNRNHWIDLGYIDRTLSLIKENDWMKNTELLRSHPAVNQDWSECPKGIIHGDLHFGNALFDKDKSLLAIIDWEEVGLGHYILDLGVTISEFCLRDGSLDKDLLKQVVNEYEKVRKLTSQEKELLLVAVDRALITAFVWKCLRKHNQGERKQWNAKDCGCFGYRN